MNPSNKLFIKWLELDAGGKATWGSKSTEEQKALFRARWHVFVGVRQSLGNCIQCNRKHIPRQQRCANHRNLNRAKCLAWAKANRASIRAEYRRRVNARVCANNPSHGKSHKEHIYCLNCYTITKVRKNEQNH